MPSTDEVTMIRQFAQLLVSALSCSSTCEAVHFGHFDVEQQEVEGSRSQPLQRDAAILGERDAVAPAARGCAPAAGD